MTSDVPDAAVIEAGLPASWSDLESMVARILRECGMDASTGVTVELARGSAELDVIAYDRSTEPEAVIAVECKHWKRRVTQQVVHAFRTVVADVGASMGLVVSASAFQAGAQEAVKHTNVRLLTWTEFQSLFAPRWFRQFMAPVLRAEADPLVEYTEPINSRIFRKADRLTEERRAEFIQLRERHLGLAFSLVPWASPLVGPESLPLPQLPLGRAVHGGLPADVAQELALRPLMKSLIRHFRAAIAEFDLVFGERA